MVDLLNKLDALTLQLTRIADSIEGKKEKRAKPTQVELAVEPTVVSISCLGGKSLDVGRSFIEVLSAAYPGVDVEQTLLEIKAWSIANPGLRWTLTGARRGINQWLQREQNKAASVALRSQINGARR